MTSDTRNVKLGVCQVFYKGYDLGYTKGGVEVSLSTEKHTVQIDQFGQTPINELIMGRNLTVTVPMAETTMENMAAIMPGATLVETGGTVASGTITIADNDLEGKTIEVNGVDVTFKATPTESNDVLLGANANETAANLAEALQASNDPNISMASYVNTVGTAIVNVKYGNPLIYGTTGQKATIGNSFTLVTGTASTAVTMSGATLSGGSNSTGKKVSVETGVGFDLLTLAHELRLHPLGKTDDDLSEDFIVPLAGNAGGLSFAYKVDEERVFNVEFVGYPDPVTKVLYKFGGR